VLAVDAVLPDAPSRASAGTEAEDADIAESEVSRPRAKRQVVPVPIEACLVRSIRIWGTLGMWHEFRMHLEISRSLDLDHLRASIPDVFSATRTRHRVRAAKSGRLLSIKAAGKSSGQGGRLQ